MPTGETHATAVIVVQDVVEQSVPPARAVAVTAGTPKSNPSSVITAAPEVGLFGLDTLLVTGDADLLVLHAHVKPLLILPPRDFQSWL